MSDIAFFFAGWEAVLRIVVVGTLAYGALVLLLRVAKRRVLARLSAFDFIVTVAIGASFGRVLTARDVPLLEALTAFVLLVTLQLVVAWAGSRSRRFTRLVTLPPLLLYFRGRFLRDAMRSESISEAELERVAREHGLGSLEGVEAIVLEPDGRFALVQAQQVGDGAALTGLRTPRDGA